MARMVRTPGSRVVGVRCPVQTFDARIAIQACVTAPIQDAICHRRGVIACESDRLQQLPDHGFIGGIEIDQTKLILNFDVDLFSAEFECRHRPINMPALIQPLIADAENRPGYRGIKRSVCFSAFEITLLEFSRG